MPRGTGPKRPTDTFGTFQERLYQTVDDIPWPTIEAAAGKVFTADERAEIFDCASIYSFKLGVEQNTASHKEREALAEEIVKHASGLLLAVNPSNASGKPPAPAATEIRGHAMGLLWLLEKRTRGGYRRWAASLGSSVDREELSKSHQAFRATFDAIEIDRAPGLPLVGESLKVAKPQLRAIVDGARGTAFDRRAMSEAIALAAPHLRAVVEAIEGGDYPTHGETKKTLPEAEALGAYVSSVLHGATPREARGRRPKDSSSRMPLEHDRWGIPIGPKAGVFRTFSVALLQREITTSQLEHAFRKPRNRRDDVEDRPGSDSRE